jgi:hypothetical protein
MEQNCSSTSEKLKLGRLVTDALGEIEPPGNTSSNFPAGRS